METPTHTEVLLTATLDAFVQRAPSPELVLTEVRRAPVRRLRHRLRSLAAPPVTAGHGRALRLSVVAAALVVALGTTAVITSHDGGDSGPQAGAGASESPVRFVSIRQALNTAADRIHVAGDTPVPEGKFRYVDERTWELNSCGPSCGLPEGKVLAYLGEVQTQNWQPSDIDGEWLRRIAVTGNQQWLFGNAKEWNERLGGEAGAKAKGFKLADATKGTREWRALGGRFPFPDPLPVEPTFTVWNAPSTQQLADLPRDPQRLYDKLLCPARETLSGPDCVLDNAASLLNTGTVPADLKEALYRAMIRLPGLTVTEQVANLDGRKGVALGVASPEAEEHDLREIIVDPDTGEFIGQRMTKLKPDFGLKAGTVTFFSSIRTAIADQQGTVPPGK